MALGTGRVSDVGPITNSETPDWSPDGRYIAYASNTGNGPHEIWISEPDGSNARMITHLSASYTTREPRWSPDGAHIAFTSAVDGNRAVYVIESQGGEPHRLTTDHFNEGSPSWSADGRFVYFRSERSGVPRLYKVDWQGARTPVALGRGFEAMESPDGRRVYFLKSADRSKLFWMGPSGGTETEVPAVPLFQPGLWGVVTQGIYFVTLDDKPELRLAPFYGGPAKTLARLPTVRAEMIGCSLRSAADAFAWAQMDLSMQVWMIRNYRR